MTELFITVFETLGIPVGGLLLVTYVFLYDKKLNATEMKEHRSERAEWRDSNVTMQAANREVIELVQQTNTTIQERNLEALHEFKNTNRDIQTRNIQALEELTEAIKNNKTDHL